MNTLQIKIMKVLYTFYDSERVGFYDHFIEDTHFNKKQLQAAIKELRAMGYVHWVRGLVCEDRTGYFGSGFVLTSEGAAAIRPHIPEYER
jgi:hypothetical protein